MKDKNDQTIETYQRNFDKYVERTSQEVEDDLKILIDTFLQELPANAEILEIGSAFGRDARYMTSKGCKVLCTDVVPQALEKLSEEGFETALYDFRDKPRAEWKGRFDGFFANAVLHHATEEIFEQALWNVLEILKPGGMCAFSMKRGAGEEVSMEKVDAPRFFKYHSLEEMKDILSKYPFEIIMLRIAHEERWIHVICRKLS